ncbi:hypothetical protein [endosymbiont GvMRE of Glomus versiforme]|uniref:hypothetical protein n=1 Tax=endosymbiont GvMRE of Glomus versiforme TaxID=2039283 RepID=UPI000ED23397|nr:hypothetical protein [endosymbiont GvMRE of Glomus versiforme]RHZ37221.1 Partition protein ParA [endosymbiont GvMRE of Glomus versiforme]
MTETNLRKRGFSPFSFLAIPPKKVKKPLPDGCGRAWINDRFHLNGNNYFIYTCHSCQQKQVKKGENGQKKS